MLEFIVISGLATMGVEKVCNTLLAHKAKKRGYTYSFYKKTKKSFARKVGGVLAKFIPFVNIGYSAIVVFSTGVILLSRSEKIDEAAFGTSLKMDAVSTNRFYETADKKLEGLEDAMKLEGATPEIIKSEMKKAQDEVYLNHTRLTDEKRRELEAMSDTALWLRDLELENGLSYDERGELFPAYTSDFMNTKENAKPKAIQKTLKMVNNRSTKSE